MNEDIQNSKGLRQVKWMTLKELFLEYGNLLTEEQREKIKKWI